MKILHYQPGYSAIDQCKLLTKYSLTRYYNNVICGIVKALGESTIYEWLPSKHIGEINELSDLQLAKKFYNIEWKDSDQSELYDVLILGPYADYYNRENYINNLPDLLKCIQQVKSIIYCDMDAELWSEHSAASVHTMTFLYSLLRGEIDLGSKLKVILSVSDSVAQLNQEKFSLVKCIGIPNLDYPDSYVNIPYIQKSDRSYDVVMMKHFKNWQPWFERTQLGFRLHALENLGLLKRRLDKFSIEHPHIRLSRSHLSLGQTFQGLADILKSSLLTLTLSAPYFDLLTQPRLTSKIFESRDANTLPIFDGKLEFLSELTYNIPEFLVCRDKSGSSIDSFNDIISQLNEITDLDYESYVRQYALNVKNTLCPDKWTDKFELTVSYL